MADSLQPWMTLKANLHDRLASQAHPRFGRLSGYRLRHECRLVVGRFLHQEHSELDSAQRKLMVDQVVADALGFGPLEEYFTDDEVQEIRVEGPKAIHVNRGDGFEPCDFCFRDLELLHIIVGRLLQCAGLPPEPTPNTVVKREAPLTFLMTARFPTTRHESPVLHFRRLRPTTEWHVVHDPFSVLTCLRASERKLRLLCLSCARRRSDLIDREWLRAIDVLEAYVEGTADAEDLQATARTVHPESMTAGQEEWDLPNGTWEAAYGLYHSMGQLLDVETVKIALEASERGHEVYNALHAASTWTAPSQRDSLPYVLLDLFGHHFREVSLDAATLTWRDATIPKLAQAAYDERELPSGHLDAKRLAILADALEESGCTNEDVLTHLRGAGPHVRGCWVVDVLLGKE